MSAACSGAVIGLVSDEALEMTMVGGLGLH